MKRFAFATFAASTAIAGTLLSSGLGAGDASAAPKDGKYQFCIKTRYGQPVETKCRPYTVQGNQLIGETGTLQLIDTPIGTFAPVPPISGVLLVDKGDGKYEAINTIFVFPIATSSFDPA
ncbi:MAG: hypothetical protein QM658_06580 [Gordonia sp. (in: high G+C Gram-positive bacteria)]